MATKKLPVKMGSSGTLAQEMTLSEALKHGKAVMPKDLKKAGFVVSVFVSDPKIHGSEFYRINYSK